VEHPLRSSIQAQEFFALDGAEELHRISKGTNHALKGLVGAFACSYNLLSFRLWSSPDSTVDLWLELMMISET